MPKAACLLSGVAAWGWCYLVPPHGVAHRPRLGAEFGGGTIFDWLFLGKQCPFQRRKFLMTIFNHRPYFLCFLPLLTVWNLIYNNIYGSFSEHKFSSWHLFFTQFELSHGSDNNTSQNIGGTDAWADPISNLGTIPQSPPKSPPMVLPLLFFSLTRPCIIIISIIFVLKYTLLHYFCVY